MTNAFDQSGQTVGHQVNTWKQHSDELAEKEGALPTGYKTQSDEMLAWEVATNLLKLSFADNRPTIVGPTGSGAIDAHVTIRHKLGSLEEITEQCSMQMVRFKKQYRKLYHEGTWYTVTLLVGLEPDSK